VKVWIDLANSPHALLFAPIARRLEGLGADLVVTARDHAQTAELARERWPDVRVIGGSSPPRTFSKGSAILRRVRDLVTWGRGLRPDVALSHNSYAQLLAAAALRIPRVTAMDYEHQQANHLAFRLANRILLPEAMPEAAICRQGASRRKVTRYPGFKEEVYLGDFEPDAAVLRRLDLDDTGSTSLVVARTGPAGATYHRTENELFYELLRRLSLRPRTRCVVLARTAGQR
jgi:predicted glycosyltransferase